jgi:hypothetical protein
MDPHSLTPPEVHYLQTTIGNQAVGQLLNRASVKPLLKPAAHPQLGSSLTVQRFLDDLFEDLTDAATDVVDMITGAVKGAGKVVSGVSGGIQDIAYGTSAEQAFVKRLILEGMTDADTLTQMVYALRYPDTALRKLDPKNKADKPLIKEWQKLKKDLVLPALNRYKARRELTPEQIKQQVKRAAKQAEQGGEADARSQLDKDIRKTAKVSVEEWFAQHQPAATFLGLPIRPSQGGAVGGVHQNLAEKLAVAENKLKAMPRFKGLDGIDLADALGVRGIGGLRPPKLATGGSRPSLHCYGLAIDINVIGNPFVGLNSDKVPKMIERATLLMRGTAFKITAPPPKDRGAMEQWLLINNASEDVITYLNMDKATLEFQLGELIKAAPDLPNSMKKLSWWEKQQKSDKALRNKGDLKGRNPAKAGIMNLDEDLVRALTEAGLTWGGMYKTAKDLMHFDDRSLFRR